MTGFVDGRFENVNVQNVWLRRGVRVGAQFILLQVTWAAIAPFPPGGDPTDPANSSYNWGTLDQSVRAATDHGLRVVFSIAPGGGPPWADAPNKPASVVAGVWRPNANAFGQFSRALARRYSGSFNPGTGVLPRVRYYEAWSEPNLPFHLSPQWILVKGQWIAESPIIYRRLLNAAYAGIKSVHRSNQVIAGATEPFGDQPGHGPRVPPAWFVRQLLCLTPSLQREPCPDPAHFDILSHHPYEIGGPFQRAYNADDVTLPDFAKLTRPLAAAVRDGTVVPDHHKPVWVTEFSYNSAPPDRTAVPMGTWLRWMQESFYVLWKQGVDALGWFILGDYPTPPKGQWVAQSGLYFQNGRAKPGAVQAFSFPLVAEPAGHHRHIIWGISPETGTVRVQIYRSRAWRTFLRFRVSAHGVFTTTRRVAPHTRLRARVGSKTSLVWTVG